ncbi:TIGR03083 family protein [Nocardioides terrae]|uniref:TIGR03083 family protein n=1 Tax=Nocardioides terrae TaxID=574651 RepID=A0A1I1GWY3_9ACTN|nr:maleylpyruvate isomerase family mycothiol-dependent enzyme [Nocardioides terrae]SFC16184.1 TIGR03083 family protein [Nocardioides terrae]
MSDATPSHLQGYIDTWWQAVGDLADLADSLTDEDWSRPTDLPGWDVRAVLSHVAHLEGVLGGAPREHAEVGELEHVRGPMGQFTEIGVLTRRDTPPSEIVAQIRSYAAARHDDLVADPPTDPAAKAPGLFGAIGWDTARLLRNRPLDVWMHEQDVRRAVGRPGGLDSLGAEHATTYLLESLGYVLAKRAGAAPGTTVVAHVEGSTPAAYGVAEDGRGHRLDTPPATSTVSLRMGRETFIRLAGGRGVVDPAEVMIEGDIPLGEKVVAHLAVTP